MANPTPTELHQSDRARGALAGASARRANAIIRQMKAAPPLRRLDLDRILVAVDEHPVLGDVERVAS